TGFYGHHLDVLTHDGKIWLSWNAGNAVNVASYNGTSWSSATTIQGCTVSGPITRLYEDSNGDMILYFTNGWGVIPDKYYFYVYNDTSQSWPTTPTAVVQITEPAGVHDCDPLLAQVNGNGDYIFIWAPYNQSTQKQWMNYRTASTLAGLNTTTTKWLTYGGYVGTPMVDMWPRALIDGSNVYIFYNTERVFGDETTRGTGNIAMLEWDWNPNYDHFDYIQPAINDASDGNTIVVHDGVYNENVIINKEITLQAGSSPVIDGHGGTCIVVDADNVTVDGLAIYNGTNGIVVSQWHNNITIQNNIIKEMGNTSTTNAKGIGVGRGCTNVTIEGNEIYNISATTYAHGIMLYGDGGNIDTVFILNNEIHHIMDAGHATGITLHSYVTNITIDNGNYIHNISASNYAVGIVIWADYVPLGIEAPAFIYIANGTIENISGTGLGSAGIGADGNWTANNITIYNNTIIDPEIGIGANAASYWYIEKNRIFDNEMGIYVANVTNFYIQYNNNISDNDVGILLENSTYCNISYNNITWNQGDMGSGIWLVNSSYNEMYMNNITWNSYGIFIMTNWSWLSWNTISHNNISNNEEWGIILLGVDNETIVGNDITWNSYGGIYAESCENITIEDNNISYNGWMDADTGIYFYYTNYSYIINNTIVGNIGAGIWLENSSWNKIIENYIAENYEIEDGPAIGIHITGNSNHTLIFGNTITGNDGGIYVEGGPSATGYYYNTDTQILWNNIYDNQYGGVWYEVIGFTPYIDATWNYWGADNGPYNNTWTDPVTGRPANGDGENISWYIHFDPWTNVSVEQCNYYEIGTGSHEFNLTEEMKTKVNVTTTGNTWITITNYSGNPRGEEPINVFPLFYIDVDVGDKSLIVWPINITIYYTQQDLDNVGITEDELIGIAFWNDTANEWQYYNDTGVNTANIILGGTEYEGYVWANVWHLTPLAPTGNDTTPPYTIKTVGSPSWGDYIKSNTPINLTAYDNASGVNHTYFRIWWLNGSTWENVTGIIEYTGNFTIGDYHSEECEHRIEYWSVDYAGNEETHHNQTHYVDNSPPVTGVSIGDPHEGNYVKKSTAVTLYATDGGECAVGETRIHYRIWNQFTGWSAWQRGAWNSDVAFNFTEQCKHHIEYYAEDRLGNTEGVKNTTLYCDEVPPESDISIIDGPYNGNYVNTNTTFRIEASDPDPYGTGCAVGGAKIFWRVWNEYDGWVEYNWSTPAPSPVEFIFDENCTHHIEWYAIDALGNIETLHNVTYYSDVTPPATTIEVGNSQYGYFVNFSTPIWLNATDDGCNNGSGVEELHYIITWNGTSTPHVVYDNDANDLDNTTGNISVVIYFLEECNHTLEWWSVDYSGNAEEHNSTYFLVDNTPPDYTVEIGEPKWLKGNAWFINFSTPIWINATDNGTGECIVGSYFIWWFVVNESGDIYDMNITSNENVTIYIDEECSHLIYYYIEDDLGNGIEGWLNVFVDNSPPNITKEYGMPYYENEAGAEFITSNTPIYINATDVPELVKLQPEIPIPWAWWEGELFGAEFSIYNFASKDINVTIEYVNLSYGIPLNNLTWEETDSLPWLGIGSHIIPAAGIGNPFTAIIGLSPVDQAVLIRYTVAWNDTPWDILGRFVSEAVVEFNASTGSWEILQSLLNFDIHNNNSVAVNNFELEFWGGITPNDIFDWYDPPIEPYALSTPIGNVWYGGWGAPPV
ncbi:MAG TPA: hypothetical protein ENI33_04830, partial [Thermoplasmatales archaeon]|nr:hypothetical protein [Thermoplasmatales archaeon]